MEFLKLFSLVPLYFVQYKALGRYKIYGPRLLMGYYVFQSLVILYLLYTDFDQLVFNEVYTIALSDCIDKFVLANVVIALAVISGVWLTGFLIPKIKRLPSFEDRLTLINQSSVFFLWFFVIIKVYSYTSFSGGLLNYSIRILQGVGTAAPFVGGVLFFRSPLVGRVWLVLIFSSIVLGSVTGGRTEALFPLVTFLTGLFFAIKRSRRLTYLVACAMASIPLIYFMGLIDQTRFKLGRLNYTELGVSNFVDFWNTLNETSYEPVSIRNSGVGRLLNHPTAAVLYLTPGEIPFRGFNNLSEEIAEAFTLSGLRNTTDYSDIYQAREELGQKEFGWGMGNRYGYYSGATSGVEFNILADAYSRGNFFAVYIYFLLVTIFICWLEILFFYKFGFEQPQGLFLSIYLIAACFTFLYHSNLIAFVRNILLISVVFSLVCYCLEKLGFSKAYSKFSVS